MLHLRDVVSLVFVACFATACSRGPETIDQCSARFARFADDMPISAGRVHGAYTFDLSKMGPDRLERLRVAGLRDGGRPAFMAANQELEAVRKEFDAAPLGPRGLLMIARSSVLLRIPTGSHPSVSDLVREGCSLIPGAKLQAVALTAAQLRDKGP